MIDVVRSQTDTAFAISWQPLGPVAVAFCFVRFPRSQLARCIAVEGAAATSTPLERHYSAVWRSA